MATEEREVKVAGELYLHVGNSGAKFRVLQREGFPALEIRTSAFGNLVQLTTVYTNNEDLRRLGEMLVAASEQVLGEPYVHQARSQRWRDEHEHIDIDEDGDVGVKDVE